MNDCGFSRPISRDEFMSGTLVLKCVSYFLQRQKMHSITSIIPCTKRLSIAYEHAHTSTRSMVLTFWPHLHTHGLLSNALSVMPSSKRKKRARSSNGRLRSSSKGVCNYSNTTKNIRELGSWFLNTEHEGAYQIRTELLVETTHAYYAPWDVARPPTSVCVAHRTWSVQLR